MMIPACLVKNNAKNKKRYKKRKKIKYVKKRDFQGKIKNVKKRF